MEGQGGADLQVLVLTDGQPHCLPAAAFTRGSPGRKQKSVLGAQSTGLIYMFMLNWFGVYLGGQELTQPKNLFPRLIWLLFSFSLTLNLKVLFLIKKKKLNS